MRSTSFLTAAFFALGFALAEDHATTSDSSGTASSTGTTSTCYKLDGSEASDHVPCGTGNSVNCCHEDDICLSNGLCYQQGNRGMGLSRGSCSDRKWEDGCYAPCSEYNRDTGIAIVKISFEDEPQYCCGSVNTQSGDSDNDDEDDNGEASCEFGDPFTIPAGTAIPDIAGLSSTSEPHADSNTEDSSDADSHSESRTPAGITTPLAIALGVGIPLGLILMGFILWAVWERRRRQLRDEETERVLGADGIALAGAESDMGMSMRANLPGLHHRYGPIPSYSGRGTPSQSGFFVAQGQPLGTAVSTPPAEPEQEQGQVEAQMHNQDEGVMLSQTQTRTHNETV
ncbi:uncharacterized protein BDW70DRAFT_156711 [Aspergillus foveolatus]|uniref:uncharacterized protein n=1 Tax=Aspergillus foveolatus TaxID=210207 RepID=UPI003CCD786C